MLAEQTKDKINEDLTWMLLSQSIVLMPDERRTASWLMEGYLKAGYHFIAVEPDNSDVDEKIIWCEHNLKECKLISERATLFVYDMLLDKRAEAENEEVKFQVMERYTKLYLDK